jgi:glycogen operon protein
MAAKARAKASSSQTAAPFQIEPGRPLPYGATVDSDGVNFSVFSLHADSVTLVLFERGGTTPVAEIPFPPEGRTGNVFSIKVKFFAWENYEYGYRVYGPDAPEQGHRFNPDIIVLDPYAREVTGRDVWGERPTEGTLFPHRGRIVLDRSFDWGDDAPLQMPIEDLIMYEMHVRGFTRDESSGVKNPGTYDGMREKIPYLKELGVNAIELMPIFDFDEFENSRQNPETGEMLLNYWGYSTVNFFSPKSGFAAHNMDSERTELKTLIKELHANGIAVILDVVFNHTAEGNENGPTISFRGIDNATYYMLTPEGYYYNFSGTGNVLNCNHPAVIEFISDCLRYWVHEYHIDGFRFDLASILTREPSGAPMTDPPLLRMLSFDPVLSKTMLIAEPWDAGGLYHVGGFPSFGRWSEWNGKYRDSIRGFLRSDAGEVGELSQRIMGSPDLYEGRGPIASVNFIIAHDGFTLADLVSYNDKHNEANLENNRDGHNDNRSWNCGVEGPTDDPEILTLRDRQMKNATAILMVSQGAPMFMMGDEIGRTQQGNNNTYGQDNALNWMDWRLVDQNRDLFEFFKKMIAFRKAHPTLRNGHFFRNEDYHNVGAADITWHGIEAWNADWSEDSREIAFMLAGAYGKGGLEPDDDIYVAMNMFWEEEDFELPQPPGNRRWHVFLNTGAEIGAQIVEPGQEVLLEDQNSILLAPRSVVILVGK